MEDRQMKNKKTLLAIRALSLAIALVLVMTACGGAGGCPFDPGEGVNPPGGGVDPGGNTALTIITASLPNGAAGIWYSQTLAAAGDAPITWSITGALPGGLTFNASTGVISGTPSAAGTSAFTVKAANAKGNASKQLSITIVTLETFTSIDAFRIWLAGQPVNTKDTPYNVGLNIASLWDSNGGLSGALGDNPTKYINLSLPA
jgi:hypothetical protein